MKRVILVVMILAPLSLLSCSESPTEAAHSATDPASPVGTPAIPSAEAETAAALLRAFRARSLDGKKAAWPEQVFQHGWNFAASMEEGVSGRPEVRVHWAGGPPPRGTPLNAQLAKLREHPGGGVVPEEVTATATEVFDVIDFELWTSDEVVAAFGEPREKTKVGNFEVWTYAYSTEPEGSDLERPLGAGRRLWLNPFFVGGPRVTMVEKVGFE